MKTSISLLLLMIFFTTNTKAQNVGIGISSPVARLHVADSNVLFTGIYPSPASPGNTPVSGTGVRMMWYADKAAFRAGTASGTNWDKDNIGINSFATGANTKATGDYSVAAGVGTKASGLAAVAMGYQTNASGFSSVTLGYQTIASEQYSTALGENTTASGVGSIAMGFNTTASGGLSTTMGGFTKAIGLSSTAMGQGTKAQADYSNTMGYGTKSTSDYSTVIGRFNDTSATNRLFEIGNGLTDNTRSNALTVLADGNMGIGTVNPLEKLHVIGNIMASGTITPSDIRYKKNIHSIISPINKLMQLNGVFYYLRCEEFPQMGFDSKEQIGLIAQEVEKVLPNVVVTGNNGYKGIDYSKLVPLLIESIKEQQKQIEELKIKIRSIEKK